VARRVRQVRSALSGFQPSRSSIADTDNWWRETAPLALLTGVALVVLGGLSVLPARTWWAQREAMASARAELDLVESEVEDLRAELELLQTDAEIERQARENFDLVYPGEESYYIVPDDGS
jgi:cell division protein FtsB